MTADLRARRSRYDVGYLTGGQTACIHDCRRAMVVPLCFVVLEGKTGFQQKCVEPRAIG